jgi:hypothetical protein
MFNLVDSSPIDVKVDAQIPPTPYVFPFKRVPKGKKINMSKISNPLDPNKLRPIVKTIMEVVSDLEEDNLIMDIINAHKANGKIFNPNLFGKFQMLPVKVATFTDVAQRLYDKKHGAKIALQLNERLLSPIRAVYQDCGVISVWDGMHTAGQVALFAKHGLFGNDAADWENFEFPFFVVDDPYPSFTSEASLHHNGDGQKKWTAFDHHRVCVSLKRIFASTLTQCDIAEKIQAVCEQYECIPVDQKHSDANKAGTQTHVEALYKWKLESLRFILATHKKYWHGTKLDTQAFSLYGLLYEHMKALKLPTRGAEFDKFLDDLHAVILECFVGLNGLKKATIKAHAAWYKVAYNSKRTTKVEVPYNCALSIVLKIYKKLGGTHHVTGDAVEFNYNGFDIYSFLEQDSVLDKVDHAI